ncbi:ABC transporter permease [Streptosporangium jomthongense]|uniref:FtsX-like permease family protein n=1 Tax=Marinobacter aromaticivorans TaxID=1494078 RepID=A0ABW2IV78_9GAMM|nr:ABC transporter permease [Marinobacter aromaticivorans]GGE65252.1 ABC transporter permease [Streptosporangium jomthongense]
MTGFLSFFRFFFLPRALLSHYRRHPLQLVALGVMIVLATMLWTGVNQLTSQARASLAQSEQAVAERRQVLRDDGGALAVDDFVTLRLAGVCVMPWLEVTPSPGHHLAGQRLVGIDPLAAHCFGNSVDGAGALDQPLDGKPFVDIHTAAGISARESRLHLLVPASTNPSVLPPGYSLAGFSASPDTGELGDSFLLNLEALGVLVLLIAALLLRSVYLLGLAQRRESFALLHRFGVPPGRVQRWLALEILALALLGVVPGVWLGRWLATGLGGGFGQALEGLFDIPLYAGQGQGWLTPVLVMLAVVMVSCLGDLLFLRFRQRLALPLAVQAVVAAALLVTGLAMAWLAPSLLWVFIAVALVFAGAGWLTPLAVARLSHWRARLAKKPLVLWRYRELAVLVRRLTLPLVALQFALAMVLAVQALVTTFESTFDRWLAQRLEAAYYIEVPAGADGRKAADWLTSAQERSPDLQWHRVIRGSALLADASGEGGRQVDVFALAPISSLIREWSLLEAAERHWETLAAGDGVMINEQLARRHNLGAGDRLQLSIGGEPLDSVIVGVYPDYGRPVGEVLLNAGLLPASFNTRFESVSVTPGRPGIDRITEALRQIWDVGALTTRDNATIRELATGVFDQTFALTRAMTLLTLVLAASALLMMGWVLFSTRTWYFRLLVAWGMSQREVAAQLLRLALLLTGGIAALALPLGLWLTWALVHRINPLAFGWSLPMAVYPGFWLELAVLSLAIGLSIALLMRRQLSRPAALPASASALSGGER